MVFSSTTRTVPYQVCSNVLTPLLYHPHSTSYYHNAPSHLIFTTQFVLKNHRKIDCFYLPVASGEKRQK
jgi:hypothetical protein